MRMDAHWRPDQRRTSTSLSKWGATPIWGVSFGQGHGSAVKWSDSRTVLLLQVFVHIARNNGNSRHMSFHAYGYLHRNHDGRRLAPPTLTSATNGPTKLIMKLGSCISQRLTCQPLALGKQAVLFARCKFSRRNATRSWFQYKVQSPDSIRNIVALYWPPSLGTGLSIRKLAMGDSGRVHF